MSWYNESWLRRELVDVLLFWEEEENVPQSLVDEFLWELSMYTNGLVQRGLAEGLAEEALGGCVDVLGRRRKVQGRVDLFL